MGISNNQRVPTYSNIHYHYILEPKNKLSLLSNWDGPDYLGIVKSGYHSLFQANFFPGYPIVIWLVNRIMPSLLDSALIVAWLSLVVAIYYYIQIVNYLFKTDFINKIRAVLFFLLFPAGIFLVATYSESLYAALALAGIYYTFKKQYLKVAILMAFCTATHITGVFVLALILLMMKEQKEAITKILGVSLIGALGIIGYMIYCQIKFRDALAFIKSQTDIHGWIQHSWLHLITTVNLLNVILIVLLIFTAIYWWQKRRSFSLYSLMFLLIPAVGHQYGGFNRYVLMAFPLQLMAFEVLRKKTDLLYLTLIVMSSVWAYLVVQYVGGYIGS